MCNSTIQELFVDDFCRLCKDLQPPWSFIQEEDFLKC